MDFFQQQDRARRNTKLLVFYFVIAVFCIITSIYFVCSGLFYFAEIKAHRPPDPIPVFILWNLPVFLFSTIATLSVVTIGSISKISALSGGGCVVAKSLSGRLVAANTRDQNERKLLNVVEEIAIASGSPVPEVYILDHENRINAFAAGNSPSDAVIGVTHGCMTMLSRDELQGVIAHEFSHILNGDMRLNLRLMGVIYGILCLTVVGQVMLYARSRSREGNAAVLLGLALIVIGFIGVLFGRLIQAAVCRQREFLADASSVQFTRNPMGLSGALQKIGGAGSRIKSPHAEETSHLFFGNGLSNPFFGGLATHPPLPDRILAIDPNWDGNFQQAKIPKVKDPKAEKNHGRKSPLPKSPLPRIPGFQGKQGGGADFLTKVVATGAVMESLGKPTPSHLTYAEKLRESFPESIKSSAREPLDATALIYALLMSPDQALRKQQLTELARLTTPEISQKAAALWPEVVPVASQARLPLINLALSALRQLQPDDFKKFTQALQWLIESDQKIDFFEFVLQKILKRHLDPRFNKPRSMAIQYFSLKPLLSDCTVLLSALARVSSRNSDEILNAFQAGLAYLDDDAVGLKLLSSKKCGLVQVDQALNRMAKSSPQIKKILIDSCLHVVSADGVIKEREAELLRAIADTLDCPIPPFLQGK